MGFYDLAEKALILERSGRKLIRLNVGDTNLPTPQCAIDAAVGSLRGVKSGYGSAAGLHELRERIAEREGCAVDNVVVGPGSKHLLYALMGTLCRKGDRVALPSPHWPAYMLACAQLGLKAKEMETGLGGKWAFGRVPKARMLVICNPLNPTSTIYPEKRMRDAIEKAREDGTTVVLDEAYRGLAFSTIPRYEGGNVIRVRSFSKEFNMEGWRLGYAVAPAEVVKKIIAFNQITCTCVPEFAQRAGIACLESEAEIVGPNRKAWRERVVVMADAMRKAGFRFAEPEAGIYIFATHDRMGDSESYALRLLEQKEVVVSPGSGFGNHGRFIRVCVNQPEAVLLEAAEKMAKALESG